MRQKILIIAYHFPPDSVVGAIRPAKFAKYLSRLGWQPFILTVREEYIPNKDPDRLKEVEHLPIFRTRVWPTVPEILLRIRNRIFSPFRKKVQTVGENAAAPDPGGEKKAGGGFIRAGLSALKRYIISIFTVPDDLNGWFIPAVWKGYRLMKKEGIRVIMTSSPPRTTSLIGLALSKLTGARLLTDLRDPWFQLGGKPAHVRCALTDKVELWLEKSIMENSDKVVTTNQEYTRFLLSHFPLVRSSKFCTLYNGYDPEDFANLGIVELNEKFTLSYLGTFYITRTPKEFLCALGQLLKEKVFSPGEIEVDFFGNVRSAGGELVEEMVQENGLSGCVHLQENLPYKKSLLHMKRSHVLLLFAPDDEEQNYAIPGKTFEYIGAGRDILCLGDKGATADLIRKTETGLVVDARDVGQIKNAIKDLYFRWKSGLKVVSKFDRRVFDREILTRELLRILIIIIGGEMF